MKVLLVGEASRVHRNLKVGLTSLGVDCWHVTQSGSTSWREFDDCLSPGYSGVLGGISRNISPFLKILQMPDFDVINFTNTITGVHGKYTKYFDIPMFRSKARVMSYYALGCDEVGLIRRNNKLPYSPCVTCLASGDELSKDCEYFFNPRYERSLELVRKYFDFGACSVIEYGHVEDIFGKNFSRIQFPIDITRIPFTPAKDRAFVNITHTPTRRGFKGTDVVLRAIDILRNSRDDFNFKLIEGLSYEEYIKSMEDSDIVIDQIYSQSSGMNGLEMLAAGKIVLTGASSLGRSYFDFMNQLPAFDASPDAHKLAAEIDALLNIKGNFSDLAEQGREYVKKYHSPVVVAQKFLSGWAPRIG